MKKLSLAMIFSFLLCGAQTLPGDDFYPVAEHWKIKPVMGRTFWYYSRQGNKPVPIPNIDRFPELKRVLDNSAATVFTYEPNMKLAGNAPFFVVGERWGRGTYCDKAGAKYGHFAKDVISFRPRNTILNSEGMKDYTFSSIFAKGEKHGWKAMAGFPQSIVYDFYGETPSLKSVKVFPAADNGRQVHFTVETSLDGSQYLKTGEFRGRASAQGHEIAIGRQAVYVRITVLADSRGVAHIMRTQLLGDNDAELMPYIVSASSEAEPLNPKNVPTIQEFTDALKKEYGERFQGFYIGEVCNCFNRNITETFREKRDPYYGMNTWAQAGMNFPFRPLSPRTGEETYENIVFALKKMASSYNWPGEGKASDAIFMSSYHTWDHYYCEFGSKMACRELTATNPERQRLEYMFSRSAARQYGIPWKIYTANSFYCASRQMREAARETKEKDGIYKKGSLGLGFANTSASFSYRNLLSAFMMGCNFYENECAQWFGNWQLFAGNFNQRYAVDPYPGLSPIGKAHIKAMDFILGLEDRGVPYTPLAFSVDFKHGISFSFGPWSHGLDKTACAEAGREYKMSVETMQTLLPWKAKDFTGHPAFGNLLETDNLRMANSAFGDVFDVLVPNPPSGLVDSTKFNAFKVILMTGKINITPELSQRYEDYVRQGGTLIVNCMYLGSGISEEFAGVKLLPGQAAASAAAFDMQGSKVAGLEEGDTQRVLRSEPAPGSAVLLRDEHGNALFTVADRGDGAVITCLVPQMLSDHGRDEYEGPMTSKLLPGKLMAGGEYLLKKLHDLALPLHVSGDIQFMLNKVPDGWLVTLINNRGLRKLPDGPLEIDDAYTSVVRISPQSNIEILDATELLEKGDNPILEKENGRITRVVASVSPGDVKILKIRTNTVGEAETMKKSALYLKQMAAADATAMQPPGKESPFSGWTIVNIKQRENIADYVKLEKNAVSVKAAEQTVSFFSPAAVPASEGNSVTIQCKVSGKGRIHIGVYVYENTGWKQLEVCQQQFTLETDVKPVQFTLPVKARNTGSVRPFIMVPANAEARMSEFTMQID